MPNLPCNSPSPSLRVLGQKFTAHLQRRLLSRWTIYARTRQILRFLHFCDTRAVALPIDLTREVIQAYHRHLCEHRTKYRAPLKSASVQHLLVGVNAFLVWLVREQIIPANPFCGFEMPRKEHRLPRAILSPDEIEAILNLPDLQTPRGLRDRAIVEVLYSTGLRRMEHCRLDIAHVDFVNRLVRVEQGKGRKDRLVPIGGEALTWLGRWKN